MMKNQQDSITRVTLRTGLALLAAAVVWTASPVRGDSLYPGSSTADKAYAPAISLFSDTKAHAVGDMLTVLIQENASANSSAETKTSKSESGTLGPGIGPLLQQIGVLSLSGNSAADGLGSTNRSDTLTAQIAVTVKQVLPNGNMMVEGTRKIGMNTETETITLTGVVRPQDVSASNTVPSPLVADAAIKYSGKGPVGDKQREGLISKLFKLIF